MLDQAVFTITLVLVSPQITLLLGSSGGPSQICRLTAVMGEVVDEPVW